MFRGRPVGRVQHATIPPAGVQGYGRTRRIIENNQTIPGQTDKRVFRRKQHYRNERERLAIIDLKVFRFKFSLFRITYLFGSI